MVSPWDPDAQKCKVCGTEMLLLEEYVQHCTLWCPECGTVLEGLRGLPVKDECWRVPERARSYG